MSGAGGGLRARLGALIAGERGGVLLLVPVLLLTIFVLGLVVDLGSLHYSRARLQDAADAAALAAAGALREGGDGAAEAEKYVQLYGPFGLPAGEDWFECDPGGTVTVILAAEAPLCFSRVFRAGAVSLRARAAARWDECGVGLAP